MMRLMLLTLTIAGAALFADASASSATDRLSDPKLELTGQTISYKRGNRAHLFIANKCVFILATGQSGSTALMDALNQLPNYLIRGDQWAAFWNIYESFMNYNWTVSVPESQLKFNWHLYQQSPLTTVKTLYEEHARKEKLPWFNEFDINRVMKAVRSYYVMLYGYYGRGFVSGFKDSRYVCGRSFESGRCTEAFVGFMGFLRRLCLDVKIILNSRSDPSREVNERLYSMDSSKQEDQFVRDLAQTHVLYDLYAKSNPDHAFRVYYEDLYDPKKNATLAKNLLTFLREDPSVPISFTRMPAQKVGK